MTRRRGQAALEFLSTYGFAFLLILVMIGALSYFGILNPQKFLPGRCLVSNEFSCADRQIVRTGTGAVLSMQIVNNLGSQVNFSNSVDMNATSDYATPGVAQPCVANPITIVSGQRTTVTCTMTGNFPAQGEKAKIAFTLVYGQLGGVYAREVGGEVADTIK